MEAIQSLNCNHCSAVLEAPAGTIFVTCAYCGARLAIRRNGSAYYTEVLQQFAADTNRIEQNLDVIRQQNELERIDREWQIRQETMPVRGKNRQTAVPFAAVGIVAGVLATAFGVYCFWAVVNAHAPSIFPVFGLIFILAGIGGAAGSCIKGVLYQEAEAKYQARREAILRQVNGRG